MSQYLRDILFLSLALVVEGKQKIMATPGSDVTLESRFSSDGVVTLMEWSRPDLQIQDYVFFYRNARLHQNYQNPRYRGRVELRNPEMKDGDVSITVKNVNLNDSGVYRCRTIVKNGEDSVTFYNDINLRVTGQRQEMLRMNVVEEEKPSGDLEFLQKNENTREKMITGFAVAAVVTAIISVVVVVKSEKCRQETAA